MKEIKTTPLKFYTINPSFKAGITSEKEQPLPKDIGDILNSIKNADSYQDYWNIIDTQIAQNPAFEKIDDNTYKKDEYYIKASPEIDAEYDKMVLSGLKAKGITIAPEYIDSAVSKEGFGLTVLKIKGTKNGNLIDYNKGQHLLDKNEKKAIYSQLQKLTKIGIANIDILNGKALKITPDKPHRVVANNWSNLCQIKEYASASEESSRMIILKKIYDKIFQN